MLKDPDLGPPSGHLFSYAELDLMPMRNPSPKTAISPELVLLCGGISDYSGLETQRSNEEPLIKHRALAGVGITLR
jgi:hypothetical protein